MLLNQQGWSAAWEELGYFVSQGRSPKTILPSSSHLQDLILVPMMAESTILQVVTQDIGHFAEALHSSLYLQYIVLIVLGLIFLGYSFDKYGSTDPREPEKLRPSFPLIGHLLGMFSKHTQYYDDL